MSGGSSKCESDLGCKKGDFSIADERTLLDLVKESENCSFEDGVSWQVIGSVLGRDWRECCERYCFCVCQDVSNCGWSKSEDDLLRLQVSLLGRCWVRLVQFFPGRSVFAVRNRWMVLVCCDRDCSNSISYIDCYDCCEEEEESFGSSFDEEDGFGEKTVLSLSDTFYIRIESDDDVNHV